MLKEGEVTSENHNRSSGLVIALLVALLVALIGLVALIATVLFRGSDDSAAMATFTPIAEATSPGDLIDPIPTGVPVATAILPNGLMATYDDDVDEHRVTALESLHLVQKCQLPQLHYL